MAPEIFEGKNQNKACDIWSLGVLLYEIIHRRPPFKIQDVNFFKKNPIDLKFKENLDKNIQNLLQRILVENIAKRPKIEEILENPIFKEITKTKNLRKTRIPNDRNQELRKKIKFLNN